MCRTYLFVQNILANKSESQANEELIKLVGQSPQAHEDITLGMIVSMLLEPANAQRVRLTFHLNLQCFYAFSYSLVLP